MRTEITSVNLCIKMTKPQFVKMWKTVGYDRVVEAMGPDVEDINYDGHFGPNFFCSCKEEFIPHVEETLTALLKRRYPKNERGTY